MDGRAGAAVAGPVASFHLTRERGIRVPAALARLALGRPGLRSVPGLRFARLFGTGRGRRTSISFDPARTAMFAVWDDTAALDRFLAGSPIAARARAAPEHYVARLVLTASHGRGTWRGEAPLAGIEPAAVTAGPVAVLTRADVRPGAWPVFLHATRRVAPIAAEASGLLALVGMGEAPLGRQATFSLWRDDAAVTAFAHRDPTHLDIVRRAQAGAWYPNDDFARFAVTTVEGTWDGSDPLAAAPARP